MFNRKHIGILLASAMLLSLSGCGNNSRVDLSATLKSLTTKAGYDFIKSDGKYLERAFEKHKLEAKKRLIERVNSEVPGSKLVVIKVDLDTDTKEVNLIDNITTDTVGIVYGDKIYTYKPGSVWKFFITDVDDYRLKPGTTDVKVNNTIDYSLVMDEMLNYVREYNIDFKRPDYEFTGDGFIVHNEGESGRKVNEDKFKIEFEKLANAFESGEIEVEFIELAPDITKEQIEAINTKVASFSTGYANTANRGGNIDIATSRINGTLLAPGEELSVDKRILSRNAANGYFKAGSYANGRTVQTYGGGVCQVSSTLYGAAIRAGLIPTERNAHSMAVSYVPLGLDAAISEGAKDLKIKNTYDSPIYVTGHTGGGVVTFSIYGKEDLLEGYTYKPVSSAGRSGLYANSWLIKSKDGVEIERIHLFESSYRPHG